ncbi:hypothetical protein HN011_010443, partial [Eciton burchellii]
MEDALQTILQVQTEISEMKNNFEKQLSKEQGKIEGLRNALLMLKEDIRSTPTYASVTRSPPQAQRTQCTYNGPKKHVLLVQSSNKEKSSKA